MGADTRGSGATQSAASAVIEGRGIARRQGALLILGSLALVLVGTIGAKNPWSLVWVERLFHHTAIFGLFAVLAFFVGLALLFRDPGLRWALCGAGVAVGLVWMGFMWMASTFNEPVVDTIPGPDGASYELLVRSSSDGIIDAAWVFEIRQAGSPLARYWEFGCMSDDAPGNGYESARWESRGRLILTARGGKETAIEVNPRTGQPGDRSGHPWTC